MQVSSVNRSKAPVSFVASPVQLVLNLFDVRRIACSEYHIIDNDREQQANECVSWDVHQFSEHRVPPGENEVRCSQSQSECQDVRSCKLLKVTADRSARNSPRQVPCHVSRALTEFGHAAEACCGRCLTSERNDTNQS